LGAYHFPQSDVAEGEPENSLCQGCHDSGNTSYLTKASSTTCIGCHGDADGARDHMVQNGAAFAEH
jgi:hypothetical protein